MTRMLALLLLTLMTAVPGSRATTAEDFDREAVIGYLIDHPDVILEAIDRFEAAQRVAAHADALFNQPDDPVAGNPDGRVVLVEFTDYNCPYCRAMVPVMQRLLAEVPELKVIYKEMPILAETSWYAARIALAANDQGRYRAFHEAMFGVGARSESVVDTIAELNGVEIGDLDLSQYDAKINATLALGQDLGLDGTPAFVIGDRILVGEVGYDVLRAAIDRELAEQGQ